MRLFKKMIESYAFHDSCIIMKPRNYCKHRKMNLKKKKKKKKLKTLITNWGTHRHCHIITPK